MLRFLKIIPLLLCGYLYSQEEISKSVYFEFDKYDLDQTQADSIIGLIRSIDSTQIETIDIFGYCDDIGNDDYNYTLSNNRANTIKEKLIANGVKNKIIITLEGKGRVLIEKDTINNLAEVRSRNRRVDILISLEPLKKEKIDIPGLYTTIGDNPIVGDRIFLEKLLFERGSSKLTIKAKNELDKIARALQKHKNIQFEIQGHVCCTPPFQKEAIDKDTKKRELSQNRAEAVYKYLILKKIAKTRMKFKGYGTSVSLKKGGEYDRRVEFLITKT